MKAAWAILLGTLAVAAAPLAFAQGGSITVPKTIEAGSAFSIPSTGSGKSSLYIVGPGQVLKHDVQLGETTEFPSGTLYNAGRYIAFLAGASAADSTVFDVVAAAAPKDISFLAKPSRLSVSLHDGITGAAYVFDAYHNLIVKPLPVNFDLTPASGAAQSRTVTTRDGAAWTALDSTAREGQDKFVARLGDISTTRVIRQVPGDPCGLKMNARQDGQKIALSTEPIKDCTGNAVPDGTMVTFTETYQGGQATVDVPIKRDIAEVEVPIHSGAKISVASGVVMGNQIGWGK